MVMDFDLNHGRADGWNDIGHVIHALLLDALKSDTRRIVLLDPTFEHWPLSNVEVLDALQAWGRRGARKLEMAAPDWSVCDRRHPRLLAWRKAYDHFLSIYQFEPAEVGAEWPCALLAAQGGAVLRIVELDEGRAVWSRQAGERQMALERFDAIAQRSSPGWGLTTVGL
jgi:hypothetical protein